LDDQFQAYVNRVVGSTKPEFYRQQLPLIHSSPKFQKGPSDDLQPVAFPGYSIIAPPAEDDPVNQGYYQALADCWQRLQASLPQGFVVPLPPESLHITLTDLIWNTDFVAAIQNPNFDEKLRSELSGIFATLTANLGPIRLQTVGLMVMPRAIGMTLVPSTEAAYNRILELRRSIYQHPSLLGLGIQQQYHFTAHITLGYFGDIPADLARDELADALANINRYSLETLPEFVIERAELRRFDNMMAYHRESDWPTFQF
jgi:2'-5' RNA ligase